MKENLNRAMHGVEKHLDLEATRHVCRRAKSDHREAAQAFVERGKPVFGGE